MAGMMLGVGALASGGSALAGLFGGGSGASGNASNVQLPPMFNMPNMGPAANNAFSAIGSNPNYAAGVYPQYNSIAQNTINNPFSGGAIGGAMGAGQAGWNFGDTLLGQSGTPMAYAGQALATGFDPQQALYGRTLQRVQDQTRAGLEARGLDTSPYGAGIESDALKNFNIDWQNAQLGRQQTAAGTAGSLYGTGTNLGTTGLNAMQTGALLPYQTFNTIGQNNMSALDSLLGAGSGAFGQGQGQIGDWLSYLNAGNQAGGVANRTGQLGLDQSNLAFGQGQTLGNNLGASLTALGKAYGMGMPGFTSAFGGGGGSNPNAWGGYNVTGI